MNEHPSEEDMVDGYYAGLQSELPRHLAACPECASLYRRICEALETASEAPLPLRNAQYGAEVWARVSSQLPLRVQRRPERKWLLFPAVAAAFGLVIVAGMWPEHRATARPEQETSQVAVPVPLKTEEKLAQLQQRPQARHKNGTLVPRPQPQAEPDADLVDSTHDARLLELNSLLDTDAKALPEVLEMIEGNTSDRTREHALFVLAQSDSPEAHQALMNFAKQDSNPSLQAKALRMLGMLSSAGERKELAGLYRASPNQALKREIINGLVISGSKTEAGLAFLAPQVLITDAQLESPPLIFRKGTFAAADKQQILNSVFLAADSEVLLDVLKKQPDAGMRVATIRSLAVMGEQSQVLATVYRTDKDEKVRRAVLDALLVQQNSEALSALARDELDLSRKADILSVLKLLRSQSSER